jgi:hypothetical protein
LYQADIETYDRGLNVTIDEPYGDDDDVCINANVYNDETKAFVINQLTTNQTNFEIKGSGEVWARAVHVIAPGTAFPDFVFDKDFKLLPIYDFEKYYKENHHLQGIPSASEVKKDGIDLGDLEVKLLQKIEEQALYIVDLQKQMDELKKVVNSIKK